MTELGRAAQRDLLAKKGPVSTAGRCCKWLGIGATKKGGASQEKNDKRTKKKEEAVAKGLCCTFLQREAAH